MPSKLCPPCSFPLRFAASLLDEATLGKQGYYYNVHTTKVGARLFPCLDLDLALPLRSTPTLPCCTHSPDTAAPVHAVTQSCLACPCSLPAHILLQPCLYSTPSNAATHALLPCTHSPSAVFVSNAVIHACPLYRSLARGIHLLLLCLRSTLTLPCVPSSPAHILLLLLLCLLRSTPAEKSAASWWLASSFSDMQGLAWPYDGLVASYMGN